MHPSVPLNQPKSETHARLRLAFRTIVQTSPDISMRHQHSPFKRVFLRRRTFPASAATPADGPDRARAESAWRIWPPAERPERRVPSTRHSLPHRRPAEAPVSSASSRSPASRHPPCPVRRRRPLDVYGRDARPSRPPSPTAKPRPARRRSAPAWLATHRRQRL